MTKKHYGYSGRIPDPPPNKNMELLLEKLMLEAQVKLEHLDTPAPPKDDPHPKQ